MSWADELRDTKDYIGWKLSIVAFHFRNWRGTIAFFVLVLCIWALWVTVANAEPTRQCVEREWRDVCRGSNGWSGERCWRRHVCVRHAYVDSYRRYYAAPRNDDDENSWNRRDPREERGVSCLRHSDGRPFEVRVVGPARLSEKAAMEAAVHQWQGTVAYDAGEKLMDLGDARFYRWRCNRASSNQSLVGRVGEAAVGDAAVQKKCAIVAQPCLPPMKDGAKDEKDER